MEKVNEVLKEMNLYLRYVDDEYVICEVIPETEDNRGQERDERTMKKLQEIGNGIYPSIQVTIDFPSNNANGRMPVLDTEHWMDEVEENGVKTFSLLETNGERFRYPQQLRYIVSKQREYLDSRSHKDDEKCLNKML